MASSAHSRPHIRLLWRLFVPNALVLCVAASALIVAPANGRPLILGAGLLVMLAAHLLIIRAAVGPLERLSSLMRRVDLLTR